MSDDLNEGIPIEKEVTTNEDVTKYSNDIETKQYNIEYPSDDDQLFITEVTKFNHIESLMRKMSNDFHKGTPIEDVYRIGGMWGLDHLPPIVNKRDHSVLFELPLDENSSEPPKPHYGEPKWDSCHVRLPNASQNEYKTESGVSGLQ